MTNIEQAKSLRNAGACVVLTNNQALYSADDAFKAIATQMQADTATTAAAAVAAAADNTGYSADKSTAKKTACVLASQLCASCQVKLGLLGNKTLAQSLNGTESYYLKVSDALSASRLQNVHDVMLANLALITTDYITAAQLTTFQSDITNFTGLGGSTTAVNTGSTGYTKQFKADMKLTDEDVATIKMLLKKYKSPQPLFYNKLMDACKIPAVTVRHTYVVFTITDGAGNVLPNVAGTLTRSKEAPLSDLQGVMTFDKVPAGASIASFKLTNYLTMLMSVGVKRGKTNSFDVAMELGRMTKEADAAFDAQLEAAVAAENAGAKVKKRRDKVVASVRGAVAEVVAVAEVEEVKL